ncbi:MAG: BatD family protein, partial [Bacteriovoracaceae bacterium]
MKTLLLLFTFWSVSLFADSVRVEVRPKEPLVNENFRVLFEITTDEGTDPIIHFDPLGLDVVSKNETGIRTRTTYINGRLATERSLTVVYEMVATRPGSAFLRNINVELNGKKLTHETLRIGILRVPREARNIMVRAHVDKEEVFVGESILARYYLYNKVPVTSTDIKKFPKLNKFLKRYHQEKMSAERVQMNGEIYTRRVIYTAQLFPTEAGEYRIDPITLGVQYSNRGSNPFNTFGFGSRSGQARKMTVSSGPIQIKVKALPAQGVPPSFTGLVGKHDFKLELNKNKFVVNEPIELKLVVKGPGALELYDAPKLFDEPDIEEFESNADLEVREDFSATKTFLYTYLGRDGMELEDKKIPFSYFDPDALQFKTEYLSIGKIIIAGQGGSSKNASVDEPLKTEQTPAAPASPSFEQKKLFEPIYRAANTYIYNASYITAALGVFVFLYLAFAFRDRLFTF